MRGLAGRRYLICGGASGIGEACVRRLVEEGAEVVIADHNLELARSLAADLGAATTALGYDQGDEGSVGELFATVTSGGALHGVVVAAGVHPGSIPVTEVTEERYLQVHGVNAYGVVAVLREAMTALATDGHSSVVVVGSVAGIRPVANNVVYASSKAAVQASVRSVALEYAGRGIRVNSVLPGSAITPLALRDTTVERIQEGARTSIPMLRSADSSEVASAIVFLLSDDASYVTATDLVVDGGLAAGRPS